MGNKVINFGKSAGMYSNASVPSKDISRVKEVYIDLNMTSKPNVKNNFHNEPWAIDSNINARAVQDSLKNIFTWIPGERILNPEFGSKIRKLIYEGLTDFNVEQIVSEIRHCVSEWEPRVQIQNIVNIGNIDDTEDSTVHLEVIYTIPGLSEEQYHYSLYGRR